METIANIFQAEIIQRIGWTLVHFVWQALAIGLILAIVLKLLHKSSANLRYIIACMALALIVLMQVVTIKMVDVSVETIEPVKQISVVSPKAGADAQAIVEIPQLKSQPAQIVATPRIHLKDRFIQAVEPALPYVVVGWLIGVFGLSLWHLGGWTQLQRLRRQMVKQVTPSLKTKLQQLSKALGIQKTIGLVESALLQVPTVIGHLKPVILLPTTALTGLSSEQIEAILAHELAHIKRHDYLVNMLQTVVEIFGFYHPAVWWVSRKIRVERENCCDDMAVSLCHDRVCYAKALTTMEEIRSSQLGLAIAASGGSLFERIRRLLGKDSTNERKQSWLPSVVAMLLIVASIMVLVSCESDHDVVTEPYLNPKIDQIDIDTATTADIKNVFGEPKKYAWGNEILKKSELSDRYVMIFDGDFHVMMGNDRVKEIRFEGPSNYVFGDGLMVGSSIEKAIEVLGKPEDVLDGKKNEFKANVFYKNIEGRKGYGYYARPDKKVRIWFFNNKVKAIYLTRSGFSSGGGMKLDLSELPETSYIGENGRLVDKIDYSFVNDPEVIGQWKSVDFVGEIHFFVPDKKDWPGDLFLKEIFFSDGGKTNFGDSWTKGLILDEGSKTASKYIIKEIGGEKYMFFEWKSGDYSIRHTKPSYYVLKKIETVVRVYQINRKVSDFPEAEDFSTPESAYAAINRVMAANDHEGWQRVSVKRLTERLAKDAKIRKKKKIDPKWSEVVSNARILEVRIKDGQAVVIAKLSEKLTSKPIKNPIDYRHLELEDGKWLNTGENRYDSIEQAREKFDKMVEKQLEKTKEQLISQQKYSEVIDNPKMLLGMAEELFGKLRKADYEKVLSYYDEQTGKWRRDGWKELGLDYMVHTDRPSFAVWVCRTFKDNPIKSVEMGKVFLSDKQVLKNIKAPAVPYRLVLQDGRVLDGDLYFVFWENSEKWQAAEGIDWHLQDDPIKTADTQTVEASSVSSELPLLDRLFDAIQDAYSEKDWAKVDVIAESIRDAFRKNEAYYIERIGQDKANIFEELSDELHDAIRDKKLYLAPAYYEQLIKTWFDCRIHNADPAFHVQSDLQVTAIITTGKRTFRKAK